MNRNNIVTFILIFSYIIIRDHYVIFEIYENNAKVKIKISQ